MNLLALLIGLQALGALIGTGYIVLAEVAYVHALRDKTIDAAERAHLRYLARGLRFGMILLLAASFALAVFAYIAHGSPQPALSSSYWTLTALALLIIGLSWALSRKRVPFALGSAGIFTAWWFLALLALGRLPVASFGAAAALYVLTTALFMALLWYARMLASPMPV